MKLKPTFIIFIVLAGINVVPAQESADYNSIFPDPINEMYAGNTIAEANQDMMMGPFIKDLSRNYYSKFGEHQLAIIIVPFDFEAVNMINYLKKADSDTLQMFEDAGCKLINYKSYEGLLLTEEDDVLIVLIIDGEYGTVSVEGYPTRKNQDYISDIMLEYLGNLNMTDIQNYIAGQLEYAHNSFKGLKEGMDKILEEEGY